MTVIFDINEATTCLSQLVERASNGEEILLADGAWLVAKLVCLPGGRSARLPRVPGGWEGLVIVNDDFDDPLPDDLQAAFDGVDDEF